MIRSGLILMIREKAMDSKSSYAVGKELGISKNTARKYREPQVQAEGQIKMPSKLDAFKEEIHPMMSEGGSQCFFRCEPSEVSKNERMKFLALKTEEGTIKGKLALYCRVLHASRQVMETIGLCNRRCIIESDKN